MMRSKLLLLVLLTVCVSLVSYTPADDYNSRPGYFRSPLDIPLFLAGTFGELRGNHFHSGIDIKTQGREGLPVYVVADGYVSRVKISPYGFGKAIYVNHPNGTTTVYAHLKKFSPYIEQVVRNIQYAKRSFAIDQYFDATTIRLGKGNVIAYSGNTGGSSGPHLHFEVRDQKTQEPLNPLLYGFEVKDDISPWLKTLWVYDRSEEDLSPDPKRYTVTNSNGRYSINKDTLYVNAKRVGLGLETFDKANGANNVNGIYEASLKANGGTIYHFKMDRFAFHETRYINAHIDHKVKQDKRIKLQRFFQLPGNRLGVYDTIVNKGLIALEPGKPVEVLFGVSDIFGNEEEMKIVLKYSDKASAFHIDHHQLTEHMPYNMDNSFSNENMKVVFPKGSFYEDTYFSYQAKNDDKRSPLSEVHQLRSSAVASHKYFDLSISPVCLPNDLTNKAVAIYDNGRSRDAIKGKLNGDEYTIRTRNIGDYYLAVDTVAPKLTASIVSGAAIGLSKGFSIKAVDNLSGINTYSAHVDGTWVLVEYDAKNARLHFLFENLQRPLEQGEHEFVLKVTDEVDNRTILKLKFKQ